MSARILKIIAIVAASFTSCFILNENAQANVLCLDLLRAGHSVEHFPRRSSGLNQFWRSTAPVEIKLGDQTFHPTFSFDSEIMPPDWLGFVHSSPEIRQAVRNEIENLVRGKIDINRMSLSEIAQLIHQSETQVLRFGLHRSVDRNKETFELLDLNPSFLETAIVQLNLAGGTVFMHIARAVVQPQIINRVLLEQRGLAVQSEVDGNNLEVKHPSYASIPIDFARHIDLLHKTFRRPQTHLHIGLPADLGAPKLDAIARAIETRAVFELAIRYEKGDKPVAYPEGTTLNAISLRVRGVVTHRKGIFSDPYKADDIELREWPTIQSGMKLMAIASELAQFHERLIIVDMPTFQTRPSRLVGNIVGALYYASELLARHQDHNIARISTQLRQLSDRAESSGQVDSDFIEEVGDFLRIHNVLELLTTDAFLVR